jgi:hypothetical protein
MSDETAPTHYPNLAGVATEDLVEQIPGNGFRASYINWARTMHMLHVEAPGWLPFLAPAPDGGYVHKAPDGSGFLMVGFEHPAHGRTPTAPQAIMDSKNKAILRDKISAREVTDTQRRGLCLAAAQFFGLAYELWAKMPLESGYRGDGVLGAIAAATDLEELEALVPELADLPEKEKAKARIAYAKRETELTAGR